MFEDKNNLIIITLLILLVLFYNMISENFENDKPTIVCNSANCQVPDEVTNTLGDFKKYCNNITYNNDGKSLTANCITRDSTTDNPTYNVHRFSFMEPCRVLNFNKNRQELICHS